MEKRTDDAQLSLFFNTTRLRDKELRERMISTGRQNGIVLRFFLDNPRHDFTPFEVQEYANLQQTPITSIRRALTTLTSMGYLVKTNIMREGEFGAVNHTWRLAHE